MYCKVHNSYVHFKTKNFANSSLGEIVEYHGKDINETSVHWTVPEK